MTVRTLTKSQKDSLVSDYKNKNRTIVDLGYNYRISPRTVARVLDEYDVPTPMPRVRGEAYRAMQLLKKHGMTVDQLESMMAAAAEPTVNMATVQAFLNQCKLFELHKAREQQKQEAHANA